MTSIFDCKEYTARRWPPYIVTNARYGRPADTVVFHFMYTPTGRVSKFWWALQLNYSLRDKQERYRRDVALWRPRARRGYRWSRPYLYSGDPKEWEGFKE